VVELHAGHGVEQRADQVLGAAVARAGIVDLARLRLGRGDQFLHRAGRHFLRVDHQRVRPGSDERDVREVLERVVRDLLVQMRAYHVRGAGEQQGIAVGRCLSDEIGADRAAGTRLVLDEELPAELLRKPRREHARGRVGEAAGRQRHHDAHRARGIGLCKALQREGHSNEEKEEAFHPRNTGSGLE
jgi:hypothetical protein